MKVHLLEGIIQHFVETQLISKDTSWYLPHSLVDHFHNTWNSPEPYELIERYDLALKSEISQRCWKRENYRPKEIMLKLIMADPELSAIAFKDLANETATLEGRLSRFDFYCTELLQMHRATHVREIETYHHQDASIISLYLAGWFPDKYALYPGLDIFQRFCAAVGSPDIPVVDDLTRYSKVAAIVFKFLNKHEEFNKLLQKRESENHRVTCMPFQTVFEIITMDGTSSNR
jgi:hypothetical protein